MALYLRGQVWWMHFYDEAGVRRSMSTGCRVAQEEKAKKRLDAVERKVAANVRLGVVTEGPLTVSRFARRWIADRERRGIPAARDEECRLRLHALPMLGQLLLSEVESLHVRNLVRDLKAKMGPGRGQMSARSVCHVYAVLHNMFGDAKREGALEQTPCDLKKGELPKKRDKDPLWRARAVFGRSEIETLISDERIPEDRRVFYALDFLGGMRTGEVSAIRWAAYEPTLEPLGKLLVAVAWDSKEQKEKGVKTENPREVPVHPALAKVLAGWKLGGFKRMMGRHPTPEDLIIPSRAGEHRRNTYMLKRFHVDCEAVGLRKRRHYDSRATFVTLTQEDGGLPHILERISHGPKGDIFGLYTRFSWGAMCAEVSKLRIELREGKLLALPKVANLREHSAAPGTALVQRLSSPGKDKGLRGVASNGIGVAAVLVAENPDSVSRPLAPSGEYSSKVSGLASGATGPSVTSPRTSVPDPVVAALLKACRAALPHHQGGHSDVGAMLRAAIELAERGAP